METKIAKLSQDNQCQVQNAEAVKKGLEAKLKKQEKELKGEAAEAQSLVNLLSKEIDETKKQLSQEKTAALQNENQLKTAVEKLELEKRYFKHLTQLYIPIFYHFHIIFTFPLHGDVLVSCKWWVFVTPLVRDQFINVDHSSSCIISWS